MVARGAEHGRHDSRDAELLQQNELPRRVAQDRPGETKTVQKVAEGASGRSNHVVSKEWALMKCVVSAQEVEPELAKVATEIDVGQSTGVASDSSSNSSSSSSSSSSDESDSSNTDSGQESLSAHKTKKRRKTGGGMMAWLILWERCGGALTSFGEGRGQIQSKFFHLIRFIIYFLSEQDVKLK